MENRTLEDIYAARKAYGRLVANVLRNQRKQTEYEITVQSVYCEIQREVRAKLRKQWLKQVKAALSSVPSEGQEKAKQQVGQLMTMNPLYPAWKTITKSLFTTHEQEREFIRKEIDLHARRKGATNAPEQPDAEQSKTDNC